MNYLAHAYLSFGIPEIAVGNMISDFVKGKKKLDYPPVIQQGITLHRAIDEFTDTHPVTRQASLFFKASYGLYAGALTDVVYDHFLANDPNLFPPDAAGAHPPAALFSSEDAGSQLISAHNPMTPSAHTDGNAPAPLPSHALAAFSQATYARVSIHAAWFPERFARMFPFMRSQDWLYNYRFREGIFNSFSGLHRRAAYMPDPEQACRLFETHYSALQTCYTEFFPALHNFAALTLQQLNDKSR